MILGLDAKWGRQWGLLLGLVALAAPQLLTHLVHRTEVRMIHQLQEILIPEFAMKRLCGFLFPGKGQRVSLLGMDYFKLEVEQILGKAMLRGLAMIQAGILALHIAQQDSPFYLDDPIVW